MLRRLVWSLVVALGIGGIGEAGIIVDPQGDAIAGFGDGGPLFDLDTLTLTTDGTTLDVVLTFFTPIAPASDLVENSLSGYIELDTDQNSATGNTPVQNFFAPLFSTSPLGIDYTISLLSEIFDPGFLEVTDANGDVVAVVPVTFTTYGLSFSISLADLGGDDGIVSATAIVATFNQPTDALAPEPSSALLAMTPLLAWVGRGLMRRRRSIGGC